MTTPPSDDLDRLLGDFYRHEMPRPWPAAPSPLAESRTAGRGDGASRSRYTLAASVALLLGLGLILSDGRVGAPARPVADGPGMEAKAQADGKKLLDAMQPKPGEPMMP